MSKTVISLLGRVAQDYRQTSYKLDDKKIEETNYFANILIKKHQPNKLIILGTATSMWDNFFANIAKTVNTKVSGNYLIEDIKTKLNNKIITQEYIDKISAKFSSDNFTIKALVVDNADSEIKQISILKKLFDSFSENEKLIIDITHGFRHISFLVQECCNLLGIMQKNILRCI